MRRAGAAALAAAGLVAAALWTAPAASGKPASITVQAERGQVATALRSLGRAGLKVQRRRGSALQVVYDRARAGRLAGLPGVAGARAEAGAFPDQAPAAPIISEGLSRTGADAIAQTADGGRGLTIAILDMGFGAGVAAMQAAGELPPAAQLENYSFDPASGLAGTNAYGNAVNHGELVAQTIYDYAPNARYLFVNYHTLADFIAATGFLISRRPDIVVHSNSFLTGPFDGSGPIARAVDRAAAAGILWFNSAGNYAQLHWEGPWNDPDLDRDHDWPDDWTFARTAGAPTTFALSWSSPPSGTTDIDLLIEREQEPGVWVEAASSTNRQSAGAPPSEEIVGFRPPVAGTYRLRAVLVSGSPPQGPMTLFSREIPLAVIGGTAVSSLPTPSDARGAIGVGAVDWRGDALKSYSSWGPTDDGRLKPDLVAPTNTGLRGPGGRRGVGGTSNAAPNAAGAAALLMAAQRRAGASPSADSIRSALSAWALDLGQPGPDDTYGAGRVRVFTEPPSATALQPASRATVHGVVMGGFSPALRTRLASWTLSLDGVRIAGGSQATPPPVRVDTRRLPDGFHRLRADLRDFPGNRGSTEWAIKVDNTRPQLKIVRVSLVPLAPKRRPTRGASRKPAPQAVRVDLIGTDPGATSSLRLAATILDARGRRAASVLARTRSGALRAVQLGALYRGRYRVRLTLTDAAGNAHVLERKVVVKTKPPKPRPAR